MRKFYIILTGILFTLLFATCKQFTTDIDDYLGYWSSEAFIQSSSIDKKTYNDANGMASVASADKVTITLKVQNPKSFRFVMPPASKPKKIVEFAHFAGPKPEAGTDYELTQLSADTLTLVYKKSFLEKAEWGEKDISSTITLYADDGREFKQTFTIPLKANTPPPNPTFTVAKTTDSPAYYVLCIKAPDMDKTAGGKLLHKDLARIEINGTPYTFSVNEAQTAFTKPEADVFITHSDVEKLDEPDADDVPADSSWVLYYKTDVEVKAGAAKKDYTIKLIDEKDLASDIVNASTKPNKPEAEEITITEGSKTLGSGSGSSESDPIIIGTSGDKAEIRITSATANTTVHCTRTDTGSATSIPYDGNPVTVPLPLNSGIEKTYKLEYYTDGTGFVPTERKTIYYKVVKAYTVTYRVEIVDEVAGGTIEAGSTGEKTSGTVSVVRGDSVTFKGRSATGDWKVAEWKKDDVVVNGTSTTYSLSNVTADTTVTVKFYQSTLKNPTAKWRDLARAVKSAPDNATLTIDGEIKATNAEGDNGVINTYKRLTIKGNNSSAALNADSKSGILDAHNTLTLQNITLKNGKWLSNHSGGAGVYVNSGGTLIMKGSSIIENCSADNSGGGVYVQQGGTFKMHNSSAIISCSANKGGAIFVNGATVNITNCTLKGNEAVSDGGAIYAQKEGSTASTVTISGGTIGGTGTGEKNKVTGKWHFGGGIFVNDDCTLTLDSVRIIGNEAWRAGGVRANRSTVNMTNCTIKNNKTTGDDDSGGGGVYTFMGRLTMTGCTITGNEAATNGGGLNVEGTTTNITNCTFTRNTAKNGGGIYTIKTDSYPVVTISGGTIGDTDMDKANKAAGTGSDGNGGGIYIGEDCKVTLQNNGSTGCTITGNTAQRGGGVYVNGKTFTMSGNAKIEADNDVYLESEKTITVDGTLSNNPAARITPREYKENVPVLRGGSGVTLADEVGKFTVTSDVKDDGIAQAWIIDTTGKLEKSNMEVRYDKLASYLSPSPHAVEEGGVYRFKITGTIPSNHLQSAGYNQMGRLAQTIHNSNKKVALILPDSIPDLTSMNEGFYGCEYLVSLENIPSGVTDMEGCFKGCTKLTHAPAIPSGVTTMRECFKGCTDLRRASNIPSTVGNMNKCFEDCKNLTVAPQIESGVTNMERSFAGCKALTQGPDIPSSVSMMYQCFDGCKSLKGVKLMCNYDDSVSLFQDVFKNCTALEDGGIKVPQNQLQEYKNHAGKMGVTDPDKFVGF